MQVYANNLLQLVPHEFVNFVLITVFSLIIGLIERNHHHNDTDEQKLFGTDRTFTFIGILGYLLLLTDKYTLLPFLGGGIIIASLLIVYYINKIKHYSDFGITTILVALITYCIPLMLETQPFWLFLLVMVVVIVFVESKDLFASFSEKLDRKEFLTLAKFIIMAGLILPIVPNEPLVSYLSISPFKIWLAVVVISSISYISYLLRKFVFKNSGIILSGILGGFYSSTATTVVMARKLKNAKSGHLQYVSAIVMATGMMYLRVLLLVFIFNKQLFEHLALALCTLVLASFATGMVLLYFGRKESNNVQAQVVTDKNPLEFKVAIIFTLIYVLFTFITFYTIQNYGIRGLNILSVITGMADIDPFLLNLFQGKYAITLSMIGVASFQAIISNNIAKMAYACFIAGKQNYRYIIIGFGTVIIINLALIFTI